MTKMPLASPLIAGTVLLCSAGFASAETGRYTMTPTKDGILKLDTKTGAVSLCRSATTGWSCKSVKDTDQDRIDRIRELEQENARLRAQLDSRQLSPGPENGKKLELPSEEDVDKAMDFVERLLNRFKGMIENKKKNKEDEDGVPL